MLFVAYIGFGEDRDDVAYAIERDSAEEARDDIERGFDGEEWTEIAIYDEQAIRDEHIDTTGLQTWT